MLDYDSDDEYLPVGVTYKDLWPRVPSNKAVVCTDRQFPYAASGRCVDDAHGCTKLSSESCSICLNPYHVTIDCPNQGLVWQQMANPNEGDIESDSSVDEDVLWNELHWYQAWG